MSIVNPKGVSIFYNINKFTNELFLNPFFNNLMKKKRFLDKFNYPLSLINHIKSNINKYKDINHEITIVYDIETGEPIRSAFYGLV